MLPWPVGQTSEALGALHELRARIRVSGEPDGVPFDHSAALLGRVALGISAFAYTCNTETAACKGAEPWPSLPGLLYRAGWIMAILGLVVIVASLASWIDRVARTRPKT